MLYIRCGDEAVEFHALLPSQFCDQLFRSFLIVPCIQDNKDVIFAFSARKSLLCVVLRQDIFGVVCLFEESNEMLINVFRQGIVLFLRVYLQNGPYSVCFFFAGSFGQYLFQCKIKPASLMDFLSVLYTIIFSLTVVPAISKTVIFIIDLYFYSNTNGFAIAGKGKCGFYLSNGYSFSTKLSNGYFR